MEIAESTAFQKAAAIEMEPSGSGTNGEITGMDPGLYNAAFAGEKNKFEGVKDIHRQLTPNKNTVLHIHFTAKSVLKEFVEFIISLCPSLVSQANSKGETPLHIAARYGHIDAVKILIEHSRNISEDLENGIGAEKKLIRATNQELDSALHEAVRYNHIEVVKFLTEEDPDHLYSANKTGETPLYIAVERGYKDVALKILEKCKAPAYHGPDGRTALHAAVIRRDQEMGKRLLEKEYLKSSIKEADKQGCLPLHLAVQYEPIYMTQLLLKHDRNTAYVRDNEGRTALHLAARDGLPRIVKVILSHCPDCAEIVDNNGRNALHYALTHHHNVSVAKLILKKPSLSNLYNEKDVDGNTPLHTSSRNNAPNQVSKLIKHQRVDKLAFNKENRTAYDITMDQYGKREDWFGKRRREIVNNFEEQGASSAAYHRIKTSATKKDDDNCNKDSGNINKNRKDEDALIKRAMNSQLVVATLIATVTFQAGLSLPGGIIRKGENKVTPILSQNLAFIAFFITNSAAMCLSATTASIHIFLAVSKYNTMDYVKGISMLTMVAMINLIMAFVAGSIAIFGSGGVFIVFLLFFIFFSLCWSRCVINVPSMLKLNLCTVFKKSMSECTLMFKPIF